jgi:hypothetical protein
MSDAAHGGSSVANCFSFVRRSIGCWSLRSGENDRPGVTFQSVAFLFSDSYSSSDNVSTRSRPAEADSPLARIHHMQPAEAIKKLQQEHRLITKAISAIERLRAIKG